MLAVCFSSSVKESASEGQTSSFKRVCKFVPKNVNHLWAKEFV